MAIRRAAKWLAIGAAVATAAYMFVKIADHNRYRVVDKEYRALWEEYSNPNFSDEFCRYWRIDNLSDYKKALQQEFKKASAEAIEESYGEDSDELLYFANQRMINWLSGKLIERAEWQLMFNRRGEQSVGPFSIDLHSKTEFSNLAP
jgi:hypothetical protein